jgi:hypothetical protein
MIRFYELCPDNQQLIAGIVNSLASSKGLPYRFETMAVLGEALAQIDKLNQRAASRGGQTITLERKMI